MGLSRDEPTTRETPLRPNPMVPPLHFRQRYLEVDVRQDIVNNEVRYRAEGRAPLSPLFIPVVARGGSDESNHAGG
jgi:hypothetical protein